MRIFKIVIWFILLACSFVLVWLNLKLYTENFTRKEKENDIIFQLNFLNKELKENNLGKRMQSIFPEGFVFTNVLYGLSWCEIGLSDSNKIIKKQALSEALYAYNEINSSEAKSFFNAELSPKYGIFYLGWNNYLLSKILLLDTTFSDKNKYIKSYVSQCDLIRNELRKSSTPFLQSYGNQAWPADMCVAMASLSNHDHIFVEKYKSDIEDWIIKVKSKLDSKTNLIPHKVDAENGETIEGARGCSISLILRLLAEFDSSFAQEQYAGYKKHFVSTTFGLPSINEYPKGQSGLGDIDSGPVIFGVGFAGTIVSIGTFSALGDDYLAENQYKTINAFGMSYKSSNAKRYIFGQLPIADAFIAWSRSSGLNNTSNIAETSKYWRLKFHFLSFISLTMIWLLFYIKPITQKLQKR